MGYLVDINGFIKIILVGICNASAMIHANVIIIKQLRLVHQNQLQKKVNTFVKLKIQTFVVHNIIHVIASVVTIKRWPKIVQKLKILVATSVKLKRLKLHYQVMNAVVHVNMNVLKENVQKLKSKLVEPVM